MYQPSEQELSDFIRESNAIERYTPESIAEMFGLKAEESPWWVSHRHAAEAVVAAAGEGQLIPPVMLHSLLMRGLDDYTDIKGSEIGVYRACNVGVGEYKCPKPYVLSRLMEIWGQAVDRWIVSPKAGISPSERADVCWQFHHWFESIHPFADGNGRTGRLLLNNIRLISGLDWHTVYARSSEAYYEEIIKWRAAKWENVRYHSLEGAARKGI